MPTLPTISPELVQAYQEEISKNSSAATAKRKAISLNRFFDWAQGVGHIPQNPMAKEEVVNPGQTLPSNQIVKIKKNTSARTFGVIGMTVGLIILLFLLVSKLKLPIPFVINFAQEANLQTNQNQNLANQNTNSPTNPINADSAVNGAWNLFAKLKLTDSDGKPQVGSETLSFKIYNSEKNGSPLYTSGSQTITTDVNGSSLISLDGVPTDLFFQNNQLFLEPQLTNSQGATISATARIPVPTANVATNLNGYYAADPNIGAAPETIPVINSDGALVLASQSPAIIAKQGNFLLEGQTVTIKTADGGNGNIEINPDGSGYAHFLFEGNKGNFLNAQGPNLTSGSLYYGMVPNNATGYDLIRLQSGSPKMTTKFSVDALGNTYIRGDLNVVNDISTNGVERLTSGGVLENINGYTQNSGNFTINQNPGDFASIVKKPTTGGALTDVLNLTLDERGKPATSNSTYSTLVLRRYDGAAEAMALLVDQGNAQFNGQLRLGRFETNPTSIGTGSLVYNSTDNLVYFWDGTAWVSVGSGGSTSFANLTSGTNTTATMVVGSGASLSFGGTGTITASDVTCTGCVSNTELANSSITFAGDTGSTAISLGGTENIVGAGTVTTSQSGNTLTITGAASTIPADSLDFSDFKDAMTLDASTDIATAGFTLSTSGTGALNFASTGQVTFAGNIDATNGLDITNANLTVGGANFTVDQSNGDITTAGNLTVNGNTTLGNAASDTVTFTAEVNSNIIPSITNTYDLGSNTLRWNNVYANAFFQNGFGVCDSNGTNCPTSGNSGPWDEALGVTYLDDPTNLVSIGDTTTEHKLEVEGAVTGKALVSLWEKGDQDILVASNSATPNNVFRLTNDGSIVAAGTAGLTLSGASAGITFSGTGNHAIANSSAGTNLTIDAATTGQVEIGGISTGDVLLAGGSSVTGCTVINSNGNLVCSGDGAFNGGDLTTTQTTATLFNTNATTLSIGMATTLLRLGPNGNGASTITLSGGSADTGCTLDGATGDFTCSGNITTTATSGTDGFWQRNLGVLSPANITDDLAIGGIATSSATFHVASATGDVTTSGSITAAGDVAVNGGDLTTTNTTATLFNTNATTLTIGGAATTLNIAPTGNGTSSLVLSGGEADTGCTLDGSNGNFTCSGNITSSSTTGNQGWWQRNLGVLSPTNITDDLAIGGTATASASFQAFGVELAAGNVASLTSDTITTGTVLSATASAITTGSILKLGEGGDQTFSGNVIYADIDNTGGGGGAFTGNFLRFDNAAATKFLVNSNGSTSIGVGTPLQKLTVEQDAVGDILGLYDGANNLDFLLADAGVATFKPTAFDFVYTFDGVATYANNTTEAKNNAGTPYTILALENPSNDIFYLGLDHKFATVNIDIATAGVGVTLVKEYWNGTAWTTLTVTDNTTNLTIDGTITFTAPTDWATTAVNGQTKYWIRLCSKSSGDCSTGTGTNITTAPTANFTTPTTNNRFYVYGQSGDTLPALYVNDFGNVGIGDATPIATLTVGNGDLFQVAGATGNVTTAGDVAINGGDLTSTATTFNFDIGNTGTLNFRDGTNTLASIFDVGTTGNMAVSGALEVGGLTVPGTPPNYYSRFGTNTTGHSLSASSDLLISGNLELDTGLYLDGKNIYNTNGTAALILCTGNSGATCGTASALENTLSTGSWIIDNQVNVGEPVLVLNTTKGGDLFDATASGTNVFRIANNGDTTVGGGTGKLNAGTVDPPYTINGKKYATFLSGIVGVKEEVAGKAQTNEYVPGVGYRNVIDFNSLSEGSDLWLFGKATDIKTNINKLVALLTPSDPTRVWYEVDESNKRLVMYSARPTTISYRLTGPRFDSQNWPNTRNDDNPIAGFILNNPDIINNNPITTTIQSLADFTVTKVTDGFYSLRDSSNHIVDGVESIGSLVTGNIKSGYIQTQEIATNSFTAAQGTVDNLLVSTGLVTPKAQLALISPLPNTTDVTIKLGDDATSSGKLAIQNNNGDEVAAIDTQGNATFAGDVHSQNIDQIQSILNQVATDQSFLAQIINSSINTASNSADLTQLATSDLYVTDQAAINSLSVTHAIAIGSDLAINSVDNSINTIANPLSIQSLALAPVEIMDGKVKIDTNGNVTILGDLYVAGNIKTKGIQVQDSSSQDVATIDASGSAQFNNLSATGLTIAGAAEATESGVISGDITTNSTVGKGIIPSGSTEITIHNPKINDYTLVYVTPTSTTNNSVLYVKSKSAGFFTVGFTDPLDPAIDANFNWWIVQAGQ